MSLTQTSAQTITGPLTLSGAVTVNGTLTYSAAEVKKTTVFSSSGNYTVTATDRYVIIRKTVGGATIVTLPTSPATGRILTVKDGKGDSPTNNITISSGSNNIDTTSVTSITLNVAYASVDLIWDGNFWCVV